MGMRTGHATPTRRWPSLWLLIAVMAITSGACASRGGVPRPFPGAALPPGAGSDPTEAIDPPPARAAVPVESAPAGALGSVVATALAFRGVAYVNGGSDPSGFDCSGLVQFVFGQHGTPMPREVHDQYRTGREVDKGDVQPGDLVFFQTVGRGASHVGVAIGDGQFVHAPSSRGVVRVERYDGSYWSSRFVGARRVTGAPPATHHRLPGAVRSTN
jgi:cell wall-associated NlpC family hydrolase